jgi:phosphopantothenoylcysteine decarboxylase/phosphopantothenate--cysteine ligase
MPTVALAVSGSIAAYKAVEVARALVARGATVLPVLTHGATRFVAPTTFAGVCGAPAAVDMWDPAFPGELHVDLARRADVVLAAPATADLMARLASGRADDLVTALALVRRGPLVVAPAMHHRMWSHPATQRNAAQLLADGARLVGPVVGPLASGEVGMGRMADPSEVADAALAALAKVTGDLSGLRLVVTAGPTVEDLDPVRFLGNRSTGRMGFAIAARAAERGVHCRCVDGQASHAGEDLRGEGRR